MSLVTIVAQKDFITVMSDGLAVSSETEEELEQSFQKFKKIHEKQFVACTGNQGLATTIFNILPFSQQPYNLADVSKILHDRLLEAISIDLASVSVGVGGVNLDGNIEYHTFSNRPKEKKESYIITDKDGHLSIFTSPNIDADEATKEFNRLLGVFGNSTPTKVLKAQKAINEYVAAKDSSVNRIIFKQTIRK